MKALTKQDVEVLGLMVEYGAEPFFRGDPRGVDVVFSAHYAYYGVLIVSEESLSERVLAVLKEINPPKGTPNEELTDEQKGMIQLAFEIKKVLGVHLSSN